MRLLESKLFYCGMAVICCLILSALYFGYRHFGGSAGAGSTLTVKYVFTVSNTSSKALKNVGLLAGTPLAKTATQHCRKNITNQPSEAVQDETGNPGLKIHWDLIPPYTAKVVTITSEVEVGQSPRRKEPLPADRCLAPEPFIESGHIQVRQIAQKLKAKDALETAQHIYKWVSENIRYAGYVKNNRGALYALQHRDGDCTEFATLFVALCRANGVPARYMGGFVSSKSAVFKLGDYHNWAEFYHNGRWHLADPQRKIFMDDQAAADYVAYRIIRPTEGDNGALLTKINGAGLKIKAKDRPIQAVNDRVDILNMLMTKGNAS